MKKILLSLGFVAGTLAASAQPLLVEDFDAMTVGNLATDLTGATPGQNLWGIYSAGTGVSAADIAVINVSGSNNALSLTGPAGPTANPSVTRYAFKDFSVDWTARDAGNDVVFTQFKFNTGASGVTSKNSFYGVIYDNTGAPVAGYLFAPSTMTLKGLAFYDATSQGGTNNFYSFNLGASNAVITLSANQDVTVDLVWDKSTGEPIYNAIVWQDKRTASICDYLKTKGWEAYIKLNTGLMRLWIFLLVYTKIFLSLLQMA